MVVSPVNWAKGNCDITVGQDLTDGEATLQVIFPTATWPHYHVYDTKFPLLIIPTTSGTGPPTPYYALAVVEDKTDVSGNYTTGTTDSAPTSGVIAFIPLGTSAADRVIVVGDGSLSALGNLPLTKGGTFRLVAIAANNEANARRIANVSTGAGSVDYHYDSDGNNAEGALAGLGPTSQTNGIMGARVKVTASTRTSGNWKYRQNVTTSVSIRPCHGGSGGIINPKQLKVGWDDDSAGATPAEVQRLTPNSTGDVTSGNIPIDTDFGQVVGGTDYYTHIAVGQNLGDATTPAAEKPDILASGTNDTADSEEAAYAFAAADALLEEVSGGANRCGFPSGNAAIIASPWSGFAGAISLDGNNDGVYYPTANYFPLTGGWTLDVKVRRDRLGSQETIIAQYDAGVAAQSFLLVRFLTTNVVQVIIRNNAGTTRTFASTATPGIGNHDIGIDWDGSNIRIYIDGVHDGTQAETTGPTQNPGVPLTIGFRAVRTDDFLGAIGNIRISNVARYAGTGYTPQVGPYTVDANTTHYWKNEAFGNPVAVISGFTRVDAARMRTTTADQKASAAIQLSQDGAVTGTAGVNGVPTTPGVSSWSSSGYTTMQDIFKRRGTVNTTDAIPYLQVYILDAYGSAIVGPATGDFILATQRVSDSGVSDSQTIDTDANGRIRWNYTIAANSAAFNRYIKSAVARATGSHVANGPDNAASPPATFFQGGPNAQYAGPYPAYARKVVVTGTAFSASKEPTSTDASVFGINSEILFEDMWTGALSAAALNADGVPTGPGNRNFVIPNSAKCKLTTLINEGTVRIINQGENNPKTVAGIPLDLTGAEKLQGRRALWNTTAAAVDDAGSNLSTAQDLDTPLGYATGTSSLDTVAAPTDPGSFVYYQGFKDTTLGNEAAEDAAGFLLTVDITNVGFQTDNGNFGWFSQSISWVNPDLSLSLALTPKVAQSDPGVSQRFGLKVFRTTPDAYINPIEASFASVHPDENPVYVVWGLGDDGAQVFLTSGSAAPVPRVGASGTATGGSTTTLIDTAKDFLALGVLAGDFIVTTGSPGGGQRIPVSTISTTTNPNDTLGFGAVTAVGAGTGYTVNKNGDYFFDLTVPSGYFAVKVNSFARVSGSPVPGGSEAVIQIGYTFDAVAFATGLPFK